MKTRGFTMVELIIYAGLVMISLAAAYMILVTNTQNHFGTMDRLENEQVLTRIEGLLKRTMGQALNVGTSASLGGWIQIFNSTSTNVLTTFGVFEREAKLLRSGTTDSLIRNTGIFFMPPTVNGGREFEGVLFVDLDPDGDGRVQAGYDDQFVGGLVSMQTVRPYFSANNRLISLDVEVRARFFPVNQSRALRCYRPTGCPAGMTGGRDETRVFTILFRNNNLGNSPLDGMPDLALGRVYFFQDFTSRGGL
ncbi:MAG: type II secretion system protein [Bdellovibrionaceae bacterium]|nr:type II secretion system protein [Pseudobdellovibrionaceae bacterium]